MIRSNSGAALVSVIVIGAASVLFLLALASIVTSAVRATASNRWVEHLRNAAEIGIDYAVNQYNTTYPCPIDPLASNATLITSLPVSELQALPVDGQLATTGLPNVAVSIKVTKILNLSDWNQLSTLSSVYSPQLDPNKSVNAGFLSPAAGNLSQSSAGGFRIIESTATNGIYSRKIRVLLRARFDSPPSGSGPSGAGTGSTTQSYFSQPMFSNTMMSINPANGSLTIQENSSNGAGVAQSNVNGSTFNTYNLNLVTNQASSIGAGATVVGNVIVNSFGSVNGQDVVSLPGGVVNGRVSSNGSIDDSSVQFTPGVTAAAGDNVLANADKVTNPTAQRSGLNNTSPGAINSPAQSQVLLAPGQTSGAGDLGSLASVSSSHTQLSGDYQATGLTSAGVSAPVVVNNLNLATRLFVQNPIGSQNAVDIDSSSFAIANADPRNFQIWYNGSRPINLNVSNGGSFGALVYAPNAPVSLTGNGTFAGAIVGKSLNVTMTGTMKINTDLAGMSGSANSNPNLKAKLNYQLSASGSVIQGWQPVTWQESN